MLSIMASNFSTPIALVKANFVKLVTFSSIFIKKLVRSMENFPSTTSFVSLGAAERARKVAFTIKKTW